jgi:hypothetical protein
MMGRRFLALIATSAEPLPPGRIDRARKAATSLVPLIETDRFMLWSDHLYGIAQVGGHAIVGELFDRGSTRPETTLDDAAWTAIARSRGEKLIEHYWGSYVAFVTDDTGVSVVRAPMGDLGCYHARDGGVLLVASDLHCCQTSDAASPSIAAPLRGTLPIPNGGAARPASTAWRNCAAAIVCLSRRTGWNARHYGRPGPSSFGTG